MDVVLAFLRDNEALLQLLAALLAAGGAGTLVLNYFLGKREPPQTTPPPSIVITSKGKGISAYNKGNGNIDIRQAGALYVSIELARAIGLPHEIAIEAAERLADKGVSQGALESRLVDFAPGWHQARERVDRLAAADALDAATAAALKTALRTADLETLDRLCRPLEGERRFGASADRAAG